MAANTYVVSIYRRSGKTGEEVSGLVERTDTGERKAFSSSEELWAFFSDKTPSPPAKPRNSQKKQKQE